MAPRAGLTPRQRQLLDFIARYIRAHNGVSPSYDEMSKAIGGRSKSQILWLVRQLEARGYLRSTPNIARSIALVDVGAPEADLLDAISPKARALLDAYCALKDERLADVVNDALIFYLDDDAADADAAHAGMEC